MSDLVNRTETGERDIGKILDSFHGAELERYKQGDVSVVLKDIKENRLTKQQLTELIAIRYQVANFFEDMLRQMLEVIKNSPGLNPEARAALEKSVADNLKDELGEGDYSPRAHRDERKDLLEALGVNYQDHTMELGTYQALGKLNVAARSLISNLKKIIESGPAEAVACLYYYEDRIALEGFGDYNIILKGLEQKFPELAKADHDYKSGEAFWHIHSHAQHDDAHANMAKAGLKLACQSPDDAGKAHRALLDTKYALESFWQMAREEIK